MVGSGEKEAQGVPRSHRNPPPGARTRGCGAFAETHRAQEAAQETQAQAATRGRGRVILPLRTLEHPLDQAKNQRNDPGRRDREERFAFGCFRQSSQGNCQHDQIPNLEDREEIQQSEQCPVDVLKEDIQPEWRRQLLLRSDFVSFGMNDDVPGDEL